MRIQRIDVYDGVTGALSELEGGLYTTNKLKLDAVETMLTATTCNDSNLVAS